MIFTTRHKNLFSDQIRACYPLTTCSLTT